MPRWPDKQKDHAQQLEAKKLLATIWAQADQAEKSLKQFLRLAWRQVEPSANFQDNWHVDCLAEHLEALALRQIRRLIINLPPRSLKSLLISVMFPAWRWLNAPGEKFLCASYGKALAIRDSRRCRNLIASQWYQDRWSNKFGLAADQNEKGRFENSKGGFRVTSSVEGGVLGEGGSCLILDDCNDLSKMPSQVYEQEVRDWYSGVISSRSIDPATDVRLCVQQRAPYGQDITAFLLELGGWEQLVIPCEYDSNKRVSSIGWSDPRTLLGELMFPQRLGPEEVAQLKIEQRANFCTPGYTPILMADWSEKKIQDIQIGDEIIGYALGRSAGGGDHQKPRLKTATVTDISVSTRMVWRYRLASGREVHCTRDHKWYRTFKGRNRASYLPIKTRSKLHSVYKPLQPITTEEQRLYDWLGGIIDGEGSCSQKNLVAISQSAANPEVQDEIERVLTRLGFDYCKWEGPRGKRARQERSSDNPKWSKSGLYYIRGGRSSKIRLLANCHMVKRQRIINTLWSNANCLTEVARTPKDRAVCNHRVVSMEPIGEMTVYGLTTTTGNYVAWGFASQNSGQFNQKPITDGTEALRRDWFNFWGKRFDVEGKEIPVRIALSDGSVVEKMPVELPKAFEQVCQSWDMAFKDTAKNDFVAGHGWGRTGARAFLMHREHGHMNFPDTKRAVRRMSAIFPAPEKLVEDAANGPAVIADLTNEIPGLIPVKPDGGKFARVAAISGYVEAGNVYLPNPDLHSWVWKLLDEFSDVRAAVHDDDTDAMTQALARLFSGLARAGAPEFRVEPRLGEPATACHVSSEKILPEWRKFGAISPGNALLLMAETPSGALRVWAEIDAFKIDAAELGKKLAEVAWPCLDAVMRFPFDILMPKEAFEPLEPIGCYAELLESGVLSWTPPNEDWQTRLAAPARLKAAKFRSEMVEQDDAAVDRLRSLLAFQPDDFKREEYSRGKALALRRDEGMEAYQNYMAAVEGVVRGEWPKLKISPACPRLISELGSFRTDLEPPPFVDALLLGVCAPRANKSGKVTEIPANEVQRALARIGRNPRPWARRRA